MTYSPWPEAAEFVAGLAVSSIPGSVRHQAQRVLLDTAAAALAAARDPAFPTVRDELVGAPAAGTAAVWGTPACLGARSAALVNATAAVWIEFDEGHAGAAGHPGAHVVAATLAAAEAGDHDGGDVIAGIVAGYEIGVRFARAIELAPSLGAHGTWTTVAAAAGAARARGLDAETTARALTIACTLMLPALGASAVLGGHTVRNAFSGLSAHNGVLAVELAVAGVTAPASADALLAGGIVGRRYAPAMVCDALGERFELENNYLKPFPACRHAHGPLDLLRRWQASAPFPVDAIREVCIRSHRVVARFAAYPTTPFGARFSVPFLCALALLQRPLHPLGPETLAERAVRALADRIRIEVDPRAEEAYPAERHCALEIVAHDGRRWTAREAATWGDPALPLTDEELCAKFREHATPVLGREPAERVLRQWPAWAEAGSARAIARALQPN